MTNIPSKENHFNDLANNEAIYNDIALQHSNSDAKPTVVTMFVSIFASILANMSVNISRCKSYYRNIKLYITVINWF